MAGTFFQNAWETPGFVKWKIRKNERKGEDKDEKAFISYSDGHMQSYDSPV